MKNKLVFVLAALLIIILFISLFLGRQVPKTSTLQENPAIENKQMPDEMQWPIRETGQMPSPRRTITIIEAPGRENRAQLPILDKENMAQPVRIDKESEKEEAENAASTETTADSEIEDASSESEAGITILDKQPTEEEQQEMRSKGVVLY